MAGVSIRGLSKRFGAATALDGIDLEIPDGAFVAILGPSGCGKTTLLRLLAGFEHPDAGTIAIGGEEVAGAERSVPAEARNLGMVFQSYALWPHMTVAENVGYAMRVARLERRQREAKVAEALAAVNLDGMADRRPQDLSGGQRQRVALARCLAQNPRLVLLDEPLANLDVHLRDQMQEEFAAFHAKTRATMVYVTHDQAEALALADLVAVLDRGRLQQVAPPRRLYAEPETAMVAQFIGRGTLVPVDDLKEEAGLLTGSLWGLRIPLSGQARGRTSGQACVRAEHARLVPIEAGLPARVTRATYQGEHSTVALVPEADAATTLRVHVTGEAPAPGTSVGLSIARGHLLR